MIHSFIIAAVSADGFISPADDREQPSTSWTSSADRDFFMRRTKEAGVVVMGSRTFQTIGKPLPGRETIVYSTRGAAHPGTTVTGQPPSQLLNDLEARGHKEVAICGGASIYSLFLEAGAVHAIYLTVHPVLFGTGVTLLSAPLRRTLELASSQNLAENVVLLEYKVL